MNPDDLICENVEVIQIYNIYNLIPLLHIN